MPVASLILGVASPSAKVLAAVVAAMEDWIHQSFPSGSGDHPQHTQEIGAGLPPWKDPGAALFPGLQARHSPHILLGSATSRPSEWPCCRYSPIPTPIPSLFSLSL